LIEPAAFVVGQAGSFSVRASLVAVNLVDSLTGRLVPSLVDAYQAFGAGDCSVGADNIVVALGAKQLAGSRRG